MRTIGRALAVLDCFSSAAPALSLQQIAGRVQLAKSTTFRVVRTLEEGGYLVRLQDQKYCLSLKLASMGRLAERTVDVRATARPQMEALARSSRECVTLFTVEDSAFVCLDVCSTPAALTSLNRPGERAPLGLGAASLVLIANLPLAELQKIIPALSRRVRHSQRELRSILDTVRKQRYAVSHGGSIRGVSALSVPLLGAEHVSPYCLNIVMPTARVQGRIAPLLKLLRQSAGTISRGLGAAQPASA